MPRQATRPVDKLRGPVRKAALQGLDRPALDDDPLITGLSELQTKQALKVLDTYCANVQRQGTGRIQNKAAYLMSLIQSYKLGPAPGSTGSAQRLMERLSQPVSEAVQAVFDPVVDRCVLEDRALMDLLAKVPEEQALAALKKYRATVQRRGRDAIENRCGYLIGFLKQYQDGVAVVGVPGNAVHQARTLSSNGEGQHFANGQSANGRNPNANGAGSRNGATNTVAGVSSAAGTSSSNGTAGLHGGLGNPTRVRPITYLQAPVRKELETLFEAGKDKTVLEDVGLIKQLSRLGEEQALAALKNYKEASKHRRDIHNKSAYLMGILRGYIEGTNPISKAPWEGARNDDGPGVSSSTAPAPLPASGAGGNRARGRGRGPGPIADDVDRSAPNSLPQSNGTSSPPPPPPETQTQPQPQPPATPPVAPAPVVEAAAPVVAVPGPRELGGFTNAPAQTQQLSSPSPPPPPPSSAQPAPPLTSMSETPSTTSPLGSPLLEGDRRFLGGIGHSSMGGDSAQHPYDPSNSLVYLNGGGANQQPLRHASLHESLFGGSHLSTNHQGGQPRGLVGPGLLGGDFLPSGGGGEWGGVVPAHGTATRTGSPGSLFGSGLLAGDDVGTPGNSAVGNTTAVPASPGSTSALGSASGVSSSLLSGGGSGVESPVNSDAGNDAPGVLTSAATAASTGSSSVAGSSSCNGSTGWPSSSSPGSGEGRENNNSPNGNVDGNVNGVADVLARLNLVKYVPVLAEAEVDLDALRLFGEDDLKDLGFPKGPRIKLLHEVQNLSFPPRA